MRVKIAKLGRVKTIIIITVFSIIASEIMYIFLGKFLGVEVHKVGFIISGVVPLTLVPLTSWFTIGLLIKIHHMEVEMRELATFDDLTKVMSRKAFLTNAEVLYKLNKRDSKPLAMLYIDIDDFKDINDKYGHNIGDMVLSSFGEKLKENKRESDLVGRLGGEEFAFVLPETDGSGAQTFAKHLKDKIEEQYILYDGLKLRYTISIGISIFNEKNKVNLETLIKQSDISLYGAKNSGKNEIVIYN